MHHTNEGPRGPPAAASPSRVSLRVQLSLHYLSLHGAVRDKGKRRGKGGERGSPHSRGLLLHFSFSTPVAGTNRANSSSLKAPEELRDILWLVLTSLCHQSASWMKGTLIPSTPTCCGQSIPSPAQEVEVAETHRRLVPNRGASGISSPRRGVKAPSVLTRGSHDSCY